MAMSFYTKHTHRGLPIISIKLISPIQTQGVLLQRRVGVAGITFFQQETQKSVPTRCSLVSWLKILPKKIKFYWIGVTHFINEYGACWLFPLLWLGISSPLLTKSQCGGLSKPHPCLCLSSPLWMSCPLLPGPGLPRTQDASPDFPAHSRALAGPLTLASVCPLCSSAYKHAVAYPSFIKDQNPRSIPYPLLNSLDLSPALYPTTPWKRTAGCCKLLKR